MRRMLFGTISQRGSLRGSKEPLFHQSRNSISGFRRPNNLALFCAICGKGFRRKSPPQPWDPSAHASAVVCILLAEFSAQSWLFIKQDESKEPKPHHQSVFEDRHAAEKQSLAEDQREDCHINGVAHVAVEAAHDQMLRWRNRRR